MKKIWVEKAKMLFDSCVGVFFALVLVDLNMPTGLIIKTALNVLWHLLSPKVKVTAAFIVITMYIIAFSLICR